MSDNSGRKRNPGTRLPFAAASGSAEASDCRLLAGSFAPSLTFGCSRPAPVLRCFNLPPFTRPIRSLLYMASPKTTQPKARRAAAADTEVEMAYSLPDSGAVSALDVVRTNNDLTRKKGGERGSVDTQDPGYVNDQLNRVLYALDAFKKGDVSVRLTKQNDDIFAEIAEAYNSMVDMIAGVGGEVSRISKVAGVEGNLKARASADNAAGFWRDMVNNINGLVDSIAVPVLEVGKVLKNISRGNLDESFQIPVSGDFKLMAQIGRAHV